MNKGMAELQDINKDALVGKIGASCLSCNNARDDPNKQQHIVGSDGKSYVAQKKGLVSK